MIWPAYTATQTTTLRRLIMSDREYSTTGFLIPVYIDIPPQEFNR